MVFSSCQPSKNTERIYFCCQRTSSYCINGPTLTLAVQLWGPLHILPRSTVVQSLPALPLPFSARSTIVLFPSLGQLTGQSPALRGQLLPPLPTVAVMLFIPSLIFLPVQFLFIHFINPTYSLTPTSHTSHPGPAISLNQPAHVLHPPVQHLFLLHATLSCSTVSSLILTSLLLPLLTEFLFGLSCCIFLTQLDTLFSPTILFISYPSLFTRCLVGTSLLLACDSLLFATIFPMSPLSCPLISQIFHSIYMNWHRVTFQPVFHSFSFFHDCHKIEAIPDLDKIRFHNTAHNKTEVLTK